MPAGEHKKLQPSSFNVKLNLKLKRFNFKITGKLLLEASSTLKYDMSGWASCPSCVVIPKGKRAAYSQYRRRLAVVSSYKVRIGRLRKSITVEMGDSCESWAETGLLAYSCTSIYTFLTFL